jgi:hypothetical protein
MLATMCGWEMQEAIPTPENTQSCLPQIPNSGTSGNELVATLLRLSENFIRQILAEKKHFEISSKIRFIKAF